MATAAAAAGAEPRTYAENLRKSLIEDLFEGEELDSEGPGGQDDSEFDYSHLAGVGTSSGLSLQDIDKDLEEFQDHDVIKGILEQGRVLKEYARDIDDKLRTAELESIQDYIQESDNMVGLHEQVSTAARPSLTANRLCGLPDAPHRLTQPHAAPCLLHVGISAFFGGNKSPFLIVLNATKYICIPKALADLPEFLQILCAFSCRCRHLKNKCR